MKNSDARSAFREPVWAWLELAIAAAGLTLWLWLGLNMYRTGKIGLSLLILNPFLLMSAVSGVKAVRRLCRHKHSRKCSRIDMN